MNRNVTKPKEEKKNGYRYGIIYDNVVKIEEKNDYLTAPSKHCTIHEHGEHEHEHEQKKTT